MYLAFFGLAEKPFSITPDPRYLYLSTRHADALAHLVYGVNEAGGFIQLTGEVGTGKTTIIRSLLSRTPQNAEIALILNPRLSPSEFLLALCEELGIGTPDSTDASTKDIVDVLNRYLLRAHAQGRRVVLIVDEAQNLAPEVLEQIRLLTNLETETQKLLQIIMIGQPELRRLLAREDLRQIAQRVTGRYHLDPLTRSEAAAYVRHRLRVAGATADIFTPGALREIFHISQGIPRVINIICDRALLGAYTQDLHQVPASLVRRASAEVFDQGVAPSWMPLMVGGLAALILAGSAGLLWRYLPSWHQSASTAVPGRAARAPAIGAVAARVPASAPAPVAAPEISLGEAGDAAGGIPNPTPSASLTPVTAPSATVGAASALPSVLTAHRAATDPDSAFRTLLGLWKANYLPGKVDGCTQAADQGLRCLSQRGSLAELRQLNRPAILMLTDDAGVQYQVVLRQLADTAALLSMGGQSVTVSLSELTRYWYGDFVLLWHPQSRDVRDLSAGMHGSLVRQLRAQLDHWNGAAPAAGPNDQYDDSLVQLVERFQRANRLQVDGIAGIETQVALDSALAPADSPLLQSRPGQQASTRGS